MCVCVCECEVVMVDGKENWRPNRVSTADHRTMAVCVEEEGEIEEGAGLRREMVYRAGRIESWCDPLDGSIRVVVGIGRRKGGCATVEKARQGGVEFLPGDSELARPKQQQRQPKDFPSAQVQLRQGALASPR